MGTSNQALSDWMHHIVFEKGNCRGAWKDIVTRRSFVITENRRRVGDFGVHIHTLGKLLEQQWQGEGCFCVASAGSNVETTARCTKIYNRGCLTKARIRCLNKRKNPWICNRHYGTSLGRILSTLLL